MCTLVQERVTRSFVADTVSTHIPMAPHHTTNQAQLCKSRFWPWVRRAWAKKHGYNQHDFKGDRWNKQESNKLRVNKQNSWTFHFIQLHCILIIFTVICLLRSIKQLQNQVLRDIVTGRKRIRWGTGFLDKEKLTFKQFFVSNFFYYISTVTIPGFNINFWH